MSRLLKGVAKLRPTSFDKRTAFLLPHFKFPETFKHPYSKDQLIFRAAVIFGFLGMFRFSTFGKLTCHSVVLISDDRDEYQFKSGSYTELNSLLEHKNITGFYFHFTAKFHPYGRAYYCKLDDFTTPWNELCPLRTLTALSRNGLQSSNKLFKKKLLTSTSLGSYMQFIANNKTPFTPHLLRI